MFDLGAIVARIDGDVSGFKKAVGEAKQEAGRLGDTVKSIGAGIANFGQQAAIFTGVAAAGVVAFGKSAVDSYHEAEAASAQLKHAVMQVSKATWQEHAATVKLADELERKGVLDGDNIKTGLAQLSTFGLTNKAVQGLGGSLADLAVNQFGVNASGEQLTQTANMIAKALNGQFGVLEKSGIRFTEAQRAIIETGTEMEKVKAINEGFAQNLKYTNDVALTTMEGKLAALNVQWGNFKENIGGVISAILSAGLTGSDGGLFEAINALFPDDETAGQITDVIMSIVLALRSFAEWVQNNQGLVITFLKGFAIALAGLAVIGTIAGVIALAMNPLFLFVAAVTALYMAYETNFLGIRDITNTVVTALLDFFNNYLMPAITVLVNFIRANWNNIVLITQGTFSVLTGVIQMAWAVISTIFKVALALITGDFGKAWQAIKEGVDMFFGGFTKVLVGIIDYLRGWGGMLVSNLVKPFEDAWNRISDFMKKIRDALDFTKRHSPSVVDIVKTGVNQVNHALEGLNMNTNLSPNINSSPLSTSGAINNNQIIVSLDGALIGDEAGAVRLAEVVGDNIIRRLNSQVRH